MKVLIEQYGYDKSVLSSLLDSHYYTEMRDGKAKIPYVGYFLSHKIPDTVFILPKVFIIEGKAFGEYDPEQIIDFDKLADEHKKNVFSLSVWIYRAIKLYFQHKDKEGDEAEIMQNVVSHQGSSSETMIDIVLSLLKFNKEHKNLFTYITRLKHSGQNKINWQKTISNTQAFIQRRTPIYLNPHTKQNDINFDEELIVLFYSVLDYLNQEFRFNVRPAFGYELLKPETIQSMIDSGKGMRILRKNRRKYFTDEMVKLWNLLFTFFEQSQYVQSKDNNDEQAMLVRDFNLVFEDMIDSLIGESDLPSGLKNQKDGKIIDHIYRDSSLIEDKEQIYFIGDSKYYKDENDIGPNSIYKQFTYAKNVIQYNIDIFNNPEEHEGEKYLNYRDSKTEGYNITPNFFIRGHLEADQLNNYTDSNLNLVPSRKGSDYDISYHFGNRLFDRDTLILQTYNINFLFVLACYVQGAGEHTQAIRKIFRKNIIKVLQAQYDFYAIKPKVATEAKKFMHDNFQQVLGKVIAPYTSTTKCMALALDNKYDNAEMLSLIDSYYYRHPIPENCLEINPETLFGEDEKTAVEIPATKAKDGVLCVMMEQFDNKKDKFLPSGRIAVALKGTADSEQILRNLGNIGYILFHTRNEQNKHFFKVVSAAIVDKADNLYKNMQTGTRYLVVNFFNDFELVSESLDVSKLPFTKETRYDAQYSLLSDIKS
jgi:hypothetical protein